MFDQNNIRDLLAQAYYEAAKDNADMHMVTDVLEEVRTVLSTEKGIYEVWKALNLNLGRATGKAFQYELLLKLRQQFIDVIYANIESAIQKAITKDKEKGWEVWLLAFVDAITHWKSEIFVQLAEANFDFDKKHQEELEFYQQGIRYIMTECWAESYPMFTRLATKDLFTKEQVAKLKISAAQIQLYYFFNNAKALEHYEEAKTLCPKQAFPERGMAEYHTRQKNLEKARDHLKGVMGEEGEDFENFIGLGDTYSEESDWIAAEEWYKHAKRINPGIPQASSKLLQLYGKPELFKKKEERITELANTIIGLEPDQTFITYIDVGYAYQQNRFFEKAEEWFQKAIANNAKIPLGPLYLAYLYQEQEQYEKTEAAFMQALEVMPNYFDAIWGLGKFYELRKDWDKAIEYFEQCQTLRPEWTVYIQEGIGNAYEQMGQMEKAQTAFLKALQKEPKDNPNTDALYRIADHHKDKGALDKAITILQSIRDLKGESYEPDFNNRVGILYYEVNDYANAIEYYQKAIAIVPEESVYFENIGLAYEGAQQLEEAEEAYQKAVGIMPDSASANNRLGIFLYRQKRYEEAVDYYSKAINLNPSYAVYRNNIGLAYEYGGQIDKAELAYQKAIELDENNAQYHNDLGVFYNNQNRYEEAVEYYKKAIELDPNVALYKDNLGLAYERMGNQEQAKESYQQAAEQNPDRGKNLIKIHIEKGEYESAIALLLPAIEAEPEKLLYYDQLGLAYERSGQLEAAEKAYKTALEKATDKDIYYNNLALFYYNTSRLEEAVPLYHKAIETDPSHGVYFDNLGLALEKLGRNTEAEEAYQKAYEVEPQNALYSNRLGTLHYKKGAFEIAEQYYSTTVKNKPDDPIGWENLGLAQEKLKKIDAAKAAYEKAIEVAQLNEKDIYYNRLGILYYNQFQDAVAIEYYEKAIAIHSKAVYHENIGLAYEGLKQYEKAKQAYEQAAILQPNNTEYQGRLLKVKAMLGEEVSTQEIQAEDAASYEQLGLALQAQSKKSIRVGSPPFRSKYIKNAK